MSFQAQSFLVDDYGLIRRIAACAAQRGLLAEHPLAWAAQHVWQITADEAILTAYSGWFEEHPPEDPAGYVSTAGSDPAIITDEMISDAVEAVLLSQMRPEGPTP